MYGDESLYYYLSRTLGFAPRSVSHLETLWLHVTVRPFLYLFYFPWARIGFTTFRCVNIVLGSLLPCLVFLLSKRFRVHSLLAMAMAAVMSLHATCVAFSVHVFPDTLATALLLVGCLLYFSGRPKSATVLLCLTVLTKEAFAMFLLPLLVLGAVTYLRRRDHWRVLAPCLALVATVAANGVSHYILGGRLQGWSNCRANPEFFAKFLASYWYLPFLVVLVIQEEYDVFALSLGAPLFFLVWTYALHKGVENWYIIGPLAVALVSASVVLTRIAESIAPPAMPTWQRLSWWKRGTIGVASACCVYAVVIQPPASGWRSLGIEPMLDTLSQSAPVPNSGQIEQVVAVLGALRHKPKSLLSLDLFWAFAFYPLSQHAHHVDQRYTSDRQGVADSEGTRSLAKAIAEHDYVLWGKSNTSMARRFEEPLRACTAFKNNEYRLYHLRPSCRSALAAMN